MFPRASMKRNNLYKLFATVHFRNCILGSVIRKNTASPCVRGATTEG